MNNLFLIKKEAYWPSGDSWLCKVCFTPPSPFPIWKTFSSLICKKNITNKVNSSLSQHILKFLFFFYVHSQYNTKKYYSSPFPSFSKKKTHFFLKFIYSSMEVCLCSISRSSINKFGSYAILIALLFSLMCYTSTGDFFNFFSVLWSSLLLLSSYSSVTFLKNVIFFCCYLSILI